MKLIVLRVGTRKKGKSGNIRISFEKALLVSFIIAFSALIITQTALLNTSVKTFINGIDNLEGKPLEVNEYLYGEGSIVLELLKGEPNSSLKVMINGDVVTLFTERKLHITVKDMDVVEIDGSSLVDEVEVGIVSINGNISETCLDKKVRLKSGVKKLTRIKTEY